MGLSLTMMLVGSRAAFVALLLVVSCGSPDSPDDAFNSIPTPTLSQPDAAEICEEPTPGLVEADKVRIVGALGEDERRIVTWALDRMASAELQMPSEILVTFDPTKDTCGGAMGLCKPTLVPPVAIVCVTDVEQITNTQWSRREVIILHELAHIWRMSSDSNIDFQAIVGGDESGSGDVIWSQRTGERVATVIGWGLLDTAQRPRLTAVPCQDMYAQFVELTGVAPLEPIADECRP